MLAPPSGNGWTDAMPRSLQGCGRGSSGFGPRCLSTHNPDRVNPHDEAIQMTTTAHQNPTPTTGKAIAPSKKAAAVVPIKPQPKDIPFPGGSVSSVCDGRM